MDVADDLGPGEREQVVVAPERLRVVGEARAPEVVLRERVALDHRAHGAVEHEDAFAEEGGEGVERGGHDERRFR